jgi:hypothetical protein
LAYDVIVGRKVRQQLEDAPDLLRGYVAGTVAFLRVDPTSASAAFTVIREQELGVIVYPSGLGFLRYRVYDQFQLVVLVDLTWP